MRRELVERLCCPTCRSALALSIAKEHAGSVVAGNLRCEKCPHDYPIEGAVPRFVPRENYASSFGLQWTRFARTQLDSHSGLPISRDRFLRQTGWSTEGLSGRWVLDVGCGAGRFAEVALALGAHLVAVDYSTAVDACQANLGANERLHLLQADVYTLPLKPSQFEYVYSLGVLQHTPDVRRAFLSLLEPLRPGGQVVVDLYLRNWARWLHPKPWLRPVTSRMLPERLFSLVERSAPSLLTVSRVLGRIPFVGPLLRRAVPVANYQGVYTLPPDQLREWAILDTFDWLSPRYDQPQTPQTLRAWMSEAGLEAIQVFRAGHLTGRARKVAA
jgi:SAM-dependent methyltransferase